MTVISPRQTTILEVVGLCLLIGTIGLGLINQLMGFKLDGGYLILVCVLIINYVNLFRSKLDQATARIDDLERKLAARESPHA